MGYRGKIHARGALWAAAALVFVGAGCLPSFQESKTGVIQKSALSNRAPNSIVPSSDFDLQPGQAPEYYFPRSIDRVESVYPNPRPNASLSIASVIPELDGVLIAGTFRAHTLVPSQATVRRYRATNRTLGTVHELSLGTNINAASRMGEMTRTSGGVLYSVRLENQTLSPVRSTDGGATWTTLNNAVASVHQISSAGRDAWVMGTDNAGALRGWLFTNEGSVAAAITPPQGASANARLFKPKDGLWFLFSSDLTNTRLFRTANPIAGAGVWTEVSTPNGSDFQIADSLTTSIDTRLRSSMVAAATGALYWSLHFDTPALSNVALIQRSLDNGTSWTRVFDSRSGPLQGARLALTRELFWHPGGFVVAVFSENRPNGASVDNNTIVLASRDGQAWSRLSELIRHSYVGAGLDGAGSLWLMSNPATNAAFAPNLFRLTIRNGIYTDTSGVAEPRIGTWLPRASYQGRCLNRTQFETNVAPVLRNRCTSCHANLSAFPMPQNNIEEWCYNAAVRFYGPDGNPLSSVALTHPFSAFHPNVGGAATQQELTNVAVPWIQTEVY